MSELWAAFCRVGKAILDVGSSLFDKKKAQNCFYTSQMNKQIQQNNRDMQYEKFKDDYTYFATCFKNCLESNHSWYGLFCPKRIEDIFPQNKSDKIGGQLFPDNTYANIIFRFEVRREPLNANAHTMATQTVEYVSAKEVERMLQNELPKYIGNYYFTGLTVFEISDDKLKIVISGVDCLPSQSDFWGMMW